MTIPVDKVKSGRVVHTRAPTLSSRLNSQPSRVPITAATPAPRITGRKLQRIRRRHLQQQPLCVKCLERGFTVAATELDHKRPLWDGGEDTEANRQGLCDDCHAVKTALESQRRARGGMHRSDAHFGKYALASFASFFTPKDQ